MKTCTECGKTLPLSKFQPYTLKCGIVRYVPRCHHCRSNNRIERRKEPRRIDDIDDTETLLKQCVAKKYPMPTIMGHRISCGYRCGFTTDKHDAILKHYDSKCKKYYPSGEKSLKWLESQA